MRKKWTDEMLFSEAAKYKTRGEFSKNSSAYRVAYRRGMLDKVCAHMELRLTYWTDEMIAEEASKYETRVEFQKKGMLAYAAAYRRGILDKVCGHMKLQLVYWNIDMLILEASKWCTRGQFYTNSGAAYAAALRLGVLEEICRHMDFKYVQWTNENIAEEAAKYKTRSEFERNSDNAYQAASRIGVIDEVCAHMERGFTGFNPDIPAHFYTINFGEFIGFGISNYIDDRLQKHKNSISKARHTVHSTNTVYFHKGSSAYKLEKMVKSTMDIVNTEVEGFKTEAIRSTDAPFLFRKIKDFMDEHCDNTVG